MRNQPNFELAITRPQKKINFPSTQRAEIWYTYCPSDPLQSLFTVFGNFDFFAKTELASAEKVPKLAKNGQISAFLPPGGAKNENFEKL